MITIWKYEIEPDLVNQVYDMPAGAVILSFGLDGQGTMCFWARVDDEAPKENHVVACVGTGWPIDHNASYVCFFIGTVTHGPYVWHLFDLGGANDRLEGTDMCVIKNKSEMEK